MKKLVVAPLYQFYSGYRNPLPKTISLEGGYRLKRFDSSILKPVFELFSQGFSEREKQELENCRHCIVYGYEAIEDSPETPGEIVNNINRIVQTLRIVKPTRALPCILHFKVRGRKRDIQQVIHKPFAIISLSGAEPGVQHFNQKDARKIRLYWRKVKFLYDNYEGSYHKVLNALFFFEIGHQNHLYKPRLVHFATCLESLFNTSPTQIGYSLRVRGSLFLGKDGDERGKISESLKKIYRLRSHFVHGQGAPQSILNNPDEQEKIISEAEAISRKCIQKIFEKDLISIFGSADRLEKEFEKLELRKQSALR